MRLIGNWGRRFSIVGGGRRGGRTGGGMGGVGKIDFLYFRYALFFGGYRVVLL